jgi:hypothetical protein
LHIGITVNYFPSVPKDHVQEMNMSSIKKRFSVGWVAGLGLGIVCSTFAGSISDTYTTGDTLTAAQMNNIKTAVNGNNTAIGNLQGGVPGATCTGNPAVTGDTMVRVGSICVDKYEASVSSGAAQSVAGVPPTVDVTWFAAADACAKAGKRLLTNAEWQTAAAGTDAANCNVSGAALANTDANPTCASNFSAINMVGNASEWVADWAPVSTTVDASSSTIGEVRGGDFGDAGTATFVESGLALNSTGSGGRGFRCAR